ncbi:Respiratory burst oxidase -like protein E [Capsicum chinense]|nr:Respiratory burst oxidase -like protein E [Capsicum chinense]
MNYSRPLSTSSVGWDQNLGTRSKTKNLIERASYALKCIVLDNWQRGWILLLWVMIMAGLFTWKFLQYRRRAAVQVMGYCLATAKGAAETLKLNMALVLLPVCRNILTWPRSTRAKLLVPFDDNINFHKPTYKSLLTGIEGVTGIAMVILMAIAFTLATRGFRRNVLKLPPPFNRLTAVFGVIYTIVSCILPVDSESESDLHLGPQILKIVD